MSRRPPTVKRPIVRRLIIWIGLPLLVVYSIVAVTSYIQNKKASLDRTNAYLLELIRHQAAVLEARFSSVSRTPEIVAETIEGMRSLSEERLIELMERRLAAEPDLFGMAVSFEPKAVDSRMDAFSVRAFRSSGGVSITKSDAVSSYATADWYLIPKLIDGPYWTEPLFSAGSGNELACSFSHPVRLAGAFAGIVTADISLAELEKTLQGIDLISGYPFIIGRSGTFIAHPNPEFVLRESPFSLAETLSRPDLRALGKEMIAGRQGIVALADIHSGEKSWMVYTPIPSTGWSFAAVIPEDKVLAPVQAQLYRQIVLMIAGLFVIFLGIVVTSYGITNPLRKLTAFAGEISTGRLDVRIEGIRRRDEIQRLAEVFNKMVADLNQYIKDFTAATKAKEAVESELRIARQIQESLLPRVFPAFPERPEFDLYAKNAAAKDVAGDFYDFFFLDEDLLAVLIADVSGKGIPAALFMAVNRTLMKTVCQKGVGPAESVRMANEILSRDNDACMFTTMFLAVFNVKTGELHYANAGHNPPFVISSGRGVRLLPSMGDAFLGVDAEASYHEGRDRLEPGDLLVLFTDGVTEAVTPAGDFFGEERFVRLVADHRDDDLPAVWNRLAADLDDFQKGDQFDDITVVLLRRSG
ncbi:MAG: SpoIIE family protein phosphatase [Candidatus Aminicenantes bacterium]|nr:SpoIIE family protein phosphatase [Candidatus Aminicenantes bacterium]